MRTEFYDYFIASINRPRMTDKDNGTASRQTRKRDECLVKCPYVPPHPQEVIAGDCSWCRKVIAGDGSGAHSRSTLCLIARPLGGSHAVVCQRQSKLSMASPRRPDSRLWSVGTQTVGLAVIIINSNKNNTERYQNETNNNNNNSDVA